MNEERETMKALGEASARVAEMRREAWLQAAGCRLQGRLFYVIRRTCSLQSVVCGLSDSTGSGSGRSASRGRPSAFFGPTPNAQCLKPGFRSSFIVHRSSFARAFTLVEVLAALTLAAVILPVAMRGISLATAAASDARRQMEAASLAESKLTELRVSGDWQGSELSGDFGTDWPDYRWIADVAEWEDTTVQQLSVSVSWTARSTTRSVTLTTLVYTPEGE